MDSLILQRFTSILLDKIHILSNELRLNIHLTLFFEIVI